MITEVNTKNIETILWSTKHRRVNRR